LITTLFVAIRHVRFGINPLLLSYVKPSNVKDYKVLGGTETKDE